MVTYTLKLSKNSMANNPSAKKRIKINKRNRFQNRLYKSSVRTLIKGFLKEMEIYTISKNSETEEKLRKSLSLIYSLLDKGTKKNIFHKNTSARKKSRLALALKLVL